MKRITGGIACPKGFLAAGLHCGIKKSRLDLALIYSRIPAITAGFFTANKVKAAPVIVSGKRVKVGLSQVIIINSGNANCLTGKAGLADALDMAKSAADAVCVSQNLALVASTGIIGKRLPIEKIKKAMPAFVERLCKSGAKDAAAAIMTTDTIKKEIAVEINISGRPVRIGAIAKGVGMIQPNMATMLSFITTDANIRKPALERSLKEALGQSFNSITVDGDTSTNDCVIIMANGLAKNKQIRSGSADYKKFLNALNFVTLELAKKIVLDGEGATKFIKVRVNGAKSELDAKHAAYKVANSPLVKTAIFGCNPNFGRVAAAVGASHAQFDADSLDVYFNGMLVIKSGGVNRNLNQAGLKNIFKKKEIGIDIDLHAGKFSKTVYTCDFSYAYVRINAAYN